MARTPIIAGNWKMNNTIKEGVELVKALAPLVKRLWLLSLRTLR